MTAITLSNLARLRTVAARSQRSLAKSCGISFNVIRRLEAGGTAEHVTLGQLHRIATALNCHPMDLVEKTSQDHEAPYTDELTIREARLLRRIHRGDQITRNLSNTDRQFILPALIKGGLVRMINGHPELDEAIKFNLD